MNNPLKNLVNRVWKNNTSASMWIILAIYHGIFFLVILTNFHASSRLMGWDGLYPELNIPLNIARGLSSGWQEYYGTGLVGGHGFAATLPHTLSIALLSLVAPQELLRMIFVLLCYYLGGLGMIWVCARTLTHTFPHTSDKSRWYISLVAAMYYLFNLGSIQTFYLPLEAFTVQFAALPWLIHATLLVFERPSAKRILWLLLLSVASSTQGFIPSLFLSYTASLACISAGFIWINKGALPAWKAIASAWSAVVIGNLYWLGGVLYFSITQSKDYISAYNNIISTPEFITKSIQYGSLSKVALLQGLYWSSNELGGPIMYPWITHFSSPLIPIIGYGFFIIAAIGIILGFTTKRHTIAFGLSLAAIYTFANLAIDTPPFTSIIHAMQSLSPALAQAFRTTFTKFSINMAFFYSISIGIGLMYIIQYLSQYKKIPTSIIAIITTFLLVIYAMPVFRGNLIYSKLFVARPAIYEKLTSYLNTLPDGKIADFPQDCNEGWYNYQWGHFGSGFLWYGVKLPIMARAFDVWSANNENYYWELSRALRQQRYDEVERIFSKYDIRYVLYDQNITHCRNQRALQSSLEYLSYLEGSPLYKHKQTYTDSHILPITVFERTEKISNSYISLLENPPNIQKVPRYSDYDALYAQYGMYYADDTRPDSVIMPPLEPFSKRGEPLAQNLLPKYTEQVVATVSASELMGVSCESRTPQSDAQWSYTYSDESIIRLMDTNTSSCVHTLFGGINTSYPYTLEITTRNITGSSLSLSLTNKERQVGLDILLPQNPTLHTYRYYIPSSFPSELEYLLTIKNTSGNQYTSINDIGDIRLYKNNTVTPTISSLGSAQSVNAKITHPYSWYYEIHTTTSSAEKPMLTLAQSFDHGWQAYDVTKYTRIQKLAPFLFGKQLPNHVKVNNWENGWPIPNQEATYRIFFIPQLLEFLGLLCLPIMMIILLRRSK